MLVFSSKQVRKFSFRLFRRVHLVGLSLFVPLVMIHGMDAILQKPAFFRTVGVPIMIYILDKLLSKSESAIKLQVLNAKLLPSNVTQLVFKKPLNFSYKSGQWLTICVPDISESEFHPFTISSAPHLAGL